MRTALATLALLLVGVPAAEASVRLRVLPAIPGVVVVYQGVTYKTDARGYVALPGTRRTVVPDAIQVRELITGGRRYTFARWFGASTGADITAGLDYYQRITFTFRNLDGVPVPDSQIQKLVIKAQTGQVINRTTKDMADSVEVLAERVQPLAGGPIVKDVTWSAQVVQISGANVVRSSMQKWQPANDGHIKLELDFYPLQIRGVDAFFGRGAGGRAVLQFPDGPTQTYALHNGRVVIPALPRGTYNVTITGSGKAFKTPVSLSKPQIAELKVITWMDMGAVALFLIAFMLGLVLVGRPHLIGTTTGALRRGFRAVARVLHRPSAVGLLAIALAGGLLAHGAAPARAAADGKPPVLAYYYIWYTPTSWNRAKSDYPLLGRYDSGDPAVIRRHIEWAKAAGINGFLVSWKSTLPLDQRLATLVRIADEEHFKLGIVYEGLDFERKPVPAEQVSEDLQTFAQRYASDPAFQIFDKPLVVWAGTWEFSARQVQAVTHLARRKLRVLGSAKNVKDYDRIAPYVDGNAYYWSSVNPGTFPNYQGKLNAMSREVHHRSGLWVAPAAPGFDAKKLGGTSTVDRKDGDTLRTEWSAAEQSSPDAIGLISWNEFSENSYVEPSRAYGDRYLKVVAEITGARAPDVGEFDSDGPPAGTSLSYGAPLIAGGVIVFLVGVAIVRRRLSHHPPPRETT
jgi:hypothetical protein